MQQKPLYKVIASTLQALRNCQKSDVLNKWEDEHGARLDEIASALLPSGAGIDCGTKINTDKCTDDKIVLSCEFRHMNAVGYYDGWTQHTVTVRGSLTSDLDLHVSGKNRSGVRDYLTEVFYHALRAPVQFIDGRYVVVEGVQS